MRKFIIGLIVGLLLGMCAVSAAGTPIRLFVNGTEVFPDVSPVMIDERVMVPARFVAETFGATVNWDEKSWSVNIFSSLLPSKVTSPTQPAVDSRVTALRKLKIDAPPNNLTLGGRIYNLKIEIEIHKLRIEPEATFKYYVSQLMFAENAILTLHGREFQTIATKVLNGLLSDDQAIQALDILYANWQNR